MTETIQADGQTRGLALAPRLEQTQIWPPVAEAKAERDEKGDNVWSFERAFEQACSDVQAIFRGRNEVKGLLLIGLETGLFVATPFAWTSEAERAWLYDSLSIKYQGQAEYYIHASELSGESAQSKGNGTTPRLVRVVGMNREQTVLTRCWRIAPDPVPRLVEQEDVPCPAEPLSGVLFDRFRADSPGEGV
jgi:hypothetical protein